MLNPKEFDIFEEKVAEKTKIKNKVASFVPFLFLSKIFINFRNLLLAQFQLTCRILLSFDHFFF